MTHPPGLGSAAPAAGMIVLVWLHVVAAMAWIGGMLFLSIVLVPVLRTGGMTRERADILRVAARRFRRVVWGAVVMLLGSGPILLHLRGLSIAEPWGWPGVLQAKLTLAALVFALTLSHELYLGPRMNRLSPQPEAVGPSSLRPLRTASTWVPRLSLLLALAIVFLGLMLART